MSEQWRAVAHRGQFTLGLFTSAEIAARGYPYLPEGQFLGFLIPDGMEIQLMRWLSMDALTSFVREMKPRRVLVGVAAGEDIRGLAAPLRDAGARVVPILSSKRLDPEV